MSFSADVKQELCTHITEKNCCAAAFCYGAACFSHIFSVQRLEFHTESKELAQYLRTMFHTQGVTLLAEPYWVHGHDKLSLHTGENGAEQLDVFLKRLRLSPQRLGEENVSRVLRCDGCTGAYLAGAFLCGGTIADPQREYHVEFVSQRPEKLRELASVLSAQGAQPRLTRKNANEVLYLRASEQIEDLLACMGAGRFAMEIMNEKIFKNYRNQANRVTNCETANIDKTVAANQAVILAVEKLRQAGVLDTLPLPLRQAAAARLEQPDVSLAELAAGMQPPVSKSGLAHRMKKLLDTAAALDEKRPAQP